MKKQIYKTNDNGYLEEIRVAEFDEQGKCLEELAENIITSSPPDGLYRAKWTGTEWVEDMPQEEIDALNNVPQQPTTDERLEATEAAILALMEVLG